MNDWLVQSREQIEVCTDPLRRCYNGVWARSEWQYTRWGTLSSWPTQEAAEKSAAEWRTYDFGGRKIEHRAIHTSQKETS